MGKAFFDGWSSLFRMAVVGIDAYPSLVLPVRSTRVSKWVKAQLTLLFYRR